MEASATEDHEEGHHVQRLPQTRPRQMAGSRAVIPSVEAAAGPLHVEGARCERGGRTGLDRVLAKEQGSSLGKKRKTDRWALPYATTRH